MNNNKKKAATLSKFRVPNKVAFFPTPEDKRILEAGIVKYGVRTPDILRMAIREWSRQEAARDRDRLASMSFEERMRGMPK